MGKIWTIASQKGGVGKTTTALNLAYGLSRLGGRVLVVDSDPQEGVAIVSNLKKHTDKGLVQVLRGACEPREVLVPAKDGSMAFVGPGTAEQEDVLFFEQETAGGKTGEIIRGLSPEFDHTLIDVPAGVGAHVASLLGISTGVIMILQPRTISIRTLPSFLKMIHWVIDRSNPELQVEGVLFTMVNPHSIMEKNVLEEIRGKLPREVFFDTSIPQDESFERAGMEGLPVAMLGDGNAGARAYMKLAMEIKERELLGAQEDAEEEGHEKGLF